MHGANKLVNDDDNLELCKEALPGTNSCAKCDRKKRQRQSASFAEQFCWIATCPSTSMGLSGKNVDSTNVISMGRDGVIRIASNPQVIQHRDRWRKSLSVDIKSHTSTIAGCSGEEHRPNERVWAQGDDALARNTHHLRCGGHDR